MTRTKEEQRLARNAAQRRWNAKNPDKAHACSKRWRETHPEQARASRRRWVDANPERHRENGRRWRVNNPDKVKEYKLLRLYNLSMDQYQSMLKVQGGVCAVEGCGNEPPEGGWLQVHHDHRCCPGPGSCGKCVLDLLCRPCNVAAGQLRDDPVRVLNLAKYLERSKERVGT